MLPKKRESKECPANRALTNNDPVSYNSRDVSSSPSSESPQHYLIKPIFRIEIIMAGNPSAYSKNPSGNTESPSGHNTHLGDSKGPKSLVDANSSTHRFIVERQDLERRQKKETEEKRGNDEKEAGASIEREENEGGS